MFAPLVASSVYLGGYYFSALIVLVAGTGAGEYIKMFREKGISVPSVIIPICMAVAASGLSKDPLLFIAVLLASALISMIMSLVKGGSSVLFGAAGILYVGGLFASFSMLRTHAGKEWAALILFVTWATDVGAYLGGSLFGKHKMAPDISPNKSWEGAISGMIASGLMAVYFYRWISLPVYWLAVIGLVLGALAELGDLTESVIKRYTGVKDSGEFMPGHGGVLDRFDSLLFTGTGGLLIYWITLFVKGG